MEEDYLREVEAVREHRRTSEVRIDEEEESFEDANDKEWWDKPEVTQLFNLMVEIGFGDLVEKMKQGEPVDREEIRLMTQHLDARHRAVVRRRMRTLHVTYRQRRRHNQAKVDVRNVFPRSPDQPPSSSSSSDSLPRRAGAGPALDERLSRHSSEGSLDGLEVEEQAGASRRAAVEPVRPARRQLKGGSDLPGYSMLVDEEGKTMVDDLSPEAVEHVRCLALMELTALFDAKGIAYNHRKNKKKYSRDTGVFEVPLSVLIDNDRKSDPDVRVPIFYGNLIRELMRRGLKDEGLLRVPGSVSRMKAIRQTVESGGEVDLTTADPNDLAGLLKQFLRELPVPLLTWTYLDAFYQVLSIEKVEDKMAALCYLVLLLPPVHRDVLRALLDFLNAVVEHSDDNKMTLPSVSMIIAPNLFLAPSKPSARRSNGGVSSPGSSSSSEAQKRHLTLENATRVSMLVQLLVAYRQLLWSVPGFLIKQIRAENKDELTRKIRGDKPSTGCPTPEIIKFLSKKHSPVSRDAAKPPDDNINQMQLDGFIRVQAPQLTKSAARVKVTPELTAADVVRLFTARRDGPAGDRSPVADAEDDRHSLPPCVDATAGCVNAFDGLTFASTSTSRLYEVGGNMTGERCLYPETKIAPIHESNPKAMWRIKPGPSYSVL